MITIYGATNDPRVMESIKLTYKRSGREAFVEIYRAIEDVPEGMAQYNINLIRENAVLKFGLDQETFDILVHAWEHFQDPANCVLTDEDEREPSEDAEDDLLEESEAGPGYVGQ